MWRVRRIGRRKRGDMRWLRLGRGGRQVQHDPGREQALLQDVRQRFGAHVRVRFPDQAAEVTRLLDGDDGLFAAADILREFADSAHAQLSAQIGFAADRRNYRQLGLAPGPELRWSLFALQCALHPYVQVAAAVTVVGTQARRCVRVTDPVPLLSHLFEVLDLTIAGWEFGHILVDVDAAALADRLVSAARDLRDAMGDPPPLPPPVRELMRRNNTIDVYDPAGYPVVGAINPGRIMRERLLA
jgi:hypothetical protein